jgi:hypothetical protein
VILFDEPWEIQEPASSWEMLIRWGLGIVVLAILVRVFFGRRSDFQIGVRDGRVEYKGRFPLALRPAIEEFLLKDLAIKGPVKIYAIRTNRRWRLWFRGQLSEGEKQRIRNFVATRLGGL